MGIVIPMQINVKPKSEAVTIAGHRVILRYEPAAAPNMRWSWHIAFTRVYDYYGNAETIAAAKRDATRKINELSKRVERSA